MAFVLLIGQNIVIFALYGGRCVFGRDSYAQRCNMA